MTTNQTRADVLRYESIKIIKRYADQHGRNWRAKLSHAWLTNEDLGQMLRVARNIVGPSGLYEPELRNYKPQPKRQPTEAP